MAWADLPLDLVGDVMAYLPLPADRARLAAVCGAWRSAARQLAASGRMPWILLPSGGVCTTIGHDAAFFRIPGLPEKTTCLGGATGADAWLALDCTDDTCRRTPFWDNYCPDTGTFKDDPRPDVKHRHTYMLYNLFSNVTVPLPELDAIIGHVTETFEVRKVLMIMPSSSSSSSTPDDDDAVVVAVTTNHCEYNVILCRPGKGAFVLPYYKVIDIAFVGDILYGITTSEELLAFHLGEDEDGRPNITRFERAINSPLSLDDHDESDDDDDDDEEEEEEEEEEDDHNESDDDDHESDDDDDDDNDDNDADEEEKEEGNSSTDESDDDDEAAANQAWHDDDDGCTVPDNEETEGCEYNEEPKDMICTSRYLVQSCSGELLLVRHQSIIPMDSHSYTLKVEIFKADFCTGNWVCCSNGLPKGEALFLSRSVSKCTRVCGDIQEGFVYYTSNLQDVFDTTSSTTRPMSFQWPCQRIRRESHHFLSWFFPPKELLV